MHAHLHTCHRAVISLMSSSIPHSLGSHLCRLQPQLPCLVRSPLLTGARRTRHLHTHVGPFEWPAVLAFYPLFTFRISFHLSYTEICKVSLRCLCSELVPLKALSLHSTTSALLVEGFQKETLILDWCLNKHLFSCWCFKFRLDYTLPRSKQQPDCLHSQTMRRPPCGQFLMSLRTRYLQVLATVGAKAENTSGALSSVPVFPPQALVLTLPLLSKYKMQTRKCCLVPNLVEFPVKMMDNIFTVGKELRSFRICACLPLMDIFLCFYQKCLNCKVILPSE